MATVSEEIIRLQELARAGKGAEKIHIVRVEQIQAERAKNEKSERPKTKFIWETHSPHLWTLLHREKDPHEQLRKTCRRKKRRRVSRA